MNFEQRKKLLSALGLLSERGNKLVLDIYGLGYPVVSTSVPTACVGWNPRLKKIEFLFGEAFLEEISLDDLAATLAHECLHVLLQHTLEKLEPHEYRRANIAMDCIVNDTLESTYATTFSDALRPKLCYGMAFVQRDCTGASVREIMDLLPEDPAGGEALDEHVLEALPQELKEKLSDLVYGLKQGNSKANAAYSVDTPERATARWEKLLIQLTQTNKTEETWRRHPARLLSAYPKVVLPSEVQQEREVVTLAIDVSGSIDVDALKKFIALARSTPKTFKVETLLFNTGCWEHDLNKAFPNGAGGTSFQCVEDFLLGRRKYPKAVIVLTDGEGGEVAMKHANRWVFMTYGDSAAPEIAQYKKFKIEEFMR